MPEILSKVPLFDLSQTDRQVGYYFERGESDRSFHPLFDAVGRASGGGTAFLVENTHGIFWFSASHCFSYLTPDSGWHVNINLANGEIFQVYADQAVTPPHGTSAKDVFIAHLLPADLRRIPKPLQFDPEQQYNVGDTVFSIGYPGAYTRMRSFEKQKKVEPVLSAGRIVSRFSQVSDDLPLFIEHTCRSEPGSSGSPLFNERGEVIGVVVRGTRSTEQDLHESEDLTRGRDRSLKYNPRLRGYSEHLLRHWL